MVRTERTRIKGCSVDVYITNQRPGPTPLNVLHSGCDGSVGLCVAIELSWGQ
jgi:hypothetical protein